jgi:hypothetical protein
MPQLAFAGRKPARDLAQALRVAQLAEQHRDQLRPTAEAARMTLGFMLLDPGLKLQTREELQKSD